MGRVPTAKQELRKLQEQFLARANAPPLQKKAPRSSSSNSNVAKISLRAIVQLANSVAPGTWKRLAHPNVVAGLLMAPFMESPDRIVEPPPAIGKYNPISPSLVQSILPAEHPNFEGLCQYLGNALGIWADYFPWSNVFAPMILSLSFEHRHWACRVLIESTRRSPTKPPATEPQTESLTETLAEPQTESLAASGEPAGENQYEFLQELVGDDPTNPTDVEEFTQSLIRSAQNFGRDV